jgi:hypothetical protein
MKKQIFILVFLVVAVFASVTKSYGQNAVAGLAPRAITLDVTNPLKPIAGKAYTYSAVINPATGSAYWYATKSTTFITNHARVATEIAAGGATPNIVNATGYMTATATTTSPTSTTVTWTGAGLAGVTSAAPMFMVVEYNAGTCATSNNVKVMKIVPQNAFTIDLTNMVHGATPTAVAYDVAAENQCYAPIESSSYDAVADKMVNDYGTNVLYYELIAANFTDSYKPTFTLAGLQGTQTADIEFGTAVGTYGTIVKSGIKLSDMPLYTSAQQTVTTVLPETTGGVAIYIRVTIKNNGYEGLTNDKITLAVDAVDNAGNKDISPDGTEKAAFAESAFQTLNMRPTVTAGTTQIAQKP